MNSFEEALINEIGNMSNIAFWTRNIERRSFRINGLGGKTIVLETKGDRLDAEQKFAWVVCDQVRRIIIIGTSWCTKKGR